jgi:hypothetical protein
MRLQGGREAMVKAFDRNAAAWVWLLAVSACAAKDPTPAVKVAEPQAPVVSSAAERYERIIRNVEGCALEGYQVDPACKGLHEMTAGLVDVPADKRAELGRAMIGNASPAVRIKAAELMNIQHGKGPKPEHQDVIAEAASHERDPNVLRAFIKVIADKAASNPKVAQVLLAATEHADKDVRLQAVNALTSPANRGLAGAPAKLIQLAENDREPKVRSAACAYAGKLGSDELLPMYDKLTSSATDPDLYAACMEGLVRMFHDHPSFETANEGAYRLFLKRIAATPRTEQTPPWNVMSTFCYFSHESDLDKLAAWKKRAPWFKATEVKRVMADVIGDKSANWMARSAAVESMIGLGTSKPELDALRRSVDPKAKPVLDKIATAMAE